MARLISNSGGRTSGLMTWLELQKGLGPDDYIVFANTGKEREETLQFLHQQELNWGVKIIWLEYCRLHKWKEVSFETLSRNGEPFWELIINRYMRRTKLYLPNFRNRFCTQELKIRVMKAWMRSMGYSHWDMVVGIRNDEQQRLAKVKESNRERYDEVYPLNSAKITKPDVLRFWEAQTFDLHLQEHEGNCDICFLKAKGKKAKLAREYLTMPNWWMEMEECTGTTFRQGETYASWVAKARTDLFALPVINEPEFSCFCGD